MRLTSSCKRHNFPTIHSFIYSSFIQPEALIKHCVHICGGTQMGKHVRDPAAWQTQGIVIKTITSGKEEGRSGSDVWVQASDTD